MGRNNQRPHKFRKGDSLSIVAVAKPGYIFSGWDGDHVGSENPLILNKIISNLELQARFTRISEAIHPNFDRSYLDHLETDSQRKKALLELALFGESQIISSGNSNSYEFSAQGNEETRLKAALGQVESTELVGVFHRTLIYLLILLSRGNR